MLETLNKFEFVEPKMEYTKIDVNGVRYYIQTTGTPIDVGNTDKLFAMAHYVFNLTTKVALKARGFPNHDAESLIERIISLEKQLQDLRNSRASPYPQYQPPLTPISPLPMLYEDTRARPRLPIAAAGRDVIYDNESKGWVNPVDEEMKKAIDSGNVIDYYARQKGGQ